MDIDRIKKGWALSILTAVLATAAMTGCTRSNASPVPAKASPAASEKSLSKQVKSSAKTADGKVFYEIFVRAFKDSDGNGIGDLRGVTQKLDYLEDLGVEGIWLMPINPSPSYHGYDITDYYDINPDYGTLDDFKELLKEAKKRGISVIMDLVVNHTSEENPWFVQSAQDPKGPYRNWYKWIGLNESSPPSALDGRPAYNRKGNGQFLSVFPGGLPDLNFDNPDVRAEVKKIAKYWLTLGVDGFRLDAAKHIYEDVASDKASEETVRKNIEWWDEFRQAANEVNPNAYIVGEIWEMTPVKIAPYLKPFNSSFNFALGEELISSADTEIASSLASNLSRIFTLYDKASSGRFTDAPFLTNHDQNRVMSELNGNLDHAKMAAAQLLTLPGIPFVYYGEELGMLGRKPDEYIREPMIWSKVNTEGNTRWIKGKHNANTASVEEQMKDPDSLYNLYRKWIHWRKEIPALRSGAIGSFAAGNNKISAYVRYTDEDKVVVLHNLSGVEQAAENKEIGSKDGFHTVIAETKKGAVMTDGRITIPPYSSVVIRKQT